MFGKSSAFPMVPVVVMIQLCFTYGLVGEQQLSAFTLLECSLKFISVTTVEVTLVLSFVFKWLLLAFEQQSENETFLYM